jgi:hypothetical protein
VSSRQSPGFVDQSIAESRWMLMVRIDEICSSKHQPDSG